MLFIMKTLKDEWYAVIKYKFTALRFWEFVLYYHILSVLSLHFESINSMNASIGLATQCWQCVPSACTTNGTLRTTNQSYGSGLHAAPLKVTTKLTRIVPESHYTQYSW